MLTNKNTTIRPVRQSAFSISNKILTKGDNRQNRGEMGFSHW